jgi:hypothetical protein
LPAGELPDLRIVQMRIEVQAGGGSCGPPGPLGVRVVVINSGAARAGSFVVEVNGARQTVGQGLEAGQKISLWFEGYRYGNRSTPSTPPSGPTATARPIDRDTPTQTPTPTMPPDYNVAIVDVLDQVVESDESNNRRAERLPIPTPIPTCTPTPGAPDEIFLSGRVTLDSAGTGLPQVDIFLSYPGGKGEVVTWAATSDETGHYSSRPLPVPSFVQVRVWAEKEGYLFKPAEVTWFHTQGYDPRAVSFLARLEDPVTVTPTSTPTPAPVEEWPDLLIEFMKIQSQPGRIWCDAGPLGTLVRVANRGLAHAGPFQVEVNGVRQAVAGLGPRSSLDLWVQGYRDAQASVAIVDVDDQVRESNEANNILETILPIPTPVPTCTPSVTPTATADHATITPTPTATANHATLTPRVTTTSTPTARAATITPTSTPTPSAIPPAPSTHPDDRWIRDFERWSASFFNPGNHYTWWRARSDFNGWRPLFWASGLSFLERRGRIVHDGQGGNVLQVKYPEAKFGSRDSGVSFPWLLKGKYEALHLTYRVKFEPGFQFTTSGKLPGLCGANDDLGCFRYTGGNPPKGDDGFSVRVVWLDGDGTAATYVYHAKQAGKYGDIFRWTHADGSQVRFQPGRWHTIELFVELNDPGVPNGRASVWLDGELVSHVDTLLFRDDSQAGRRIRINEMYFSTFHGGSRSSDAPRQTQYAYFDDFQVYILGALANTEP